MAAPTRRAHAGSQGKNPDPRKVSIYLPRPLLEWLIAQDKRLDRSVSWIVQHALNHSKEWVESMPGLNDQVQPTMRLPEDQLDELAKRVAEQLRGK